MQERIYKNTIRFFSLFRQEENYIFKENLGIILTFINPEHEQSYSKDVLCSRRAKYRSAALLALAFHRVESMTKRFSTTSFS